MKTLEDRIAQLEEQLSAFSPSQSMDHLKMRRPKQIDRRSVSEVQTTSKLVSGVGLLSLCATAEPHYFGEGSGVSLAQLVEAAVYEKLRPLSMVVLPSSEESPFSCHSPTPSTPKAPLPPSQKGAIFLNTYLTRVHSTYPFLSRKYLWSIHEDREYLESAGTAEAEYDWIILQLVYAIGSRCLQLIGSSSALEVSPEELYVSAMARIDDKIKRLDIRNVRITLLIAIYAMRTPSGNETPSHIEAIAYHLTRSQCMAAVRHHGPAMP